MADDSTQIIRIVIDSSAAKDGATDAKAALQSIEAQTSSTAQAMQAVASGFEAARSAAEAFLLVEAAEKLLDIFESAEKAATSLQKLSDVTGLGVEALQGITYAASQVGVSTDQVQDSLTKFSKSIGAAADGNKEAIDAFNGLGVMLIDQQGNLRSTNAVLQDTATAILSIQDPARRVQAAVETFGRSGAQIIPVLQQLSDGTYLMTQSAQKAGAVMSTEVVEALDKLSAQADGAKQRWTALVGTIGAPIATAAMEAVNKILGDILANLDRLKQLKSEQASGVPQTKSDVDNLQDQLNTAKQSQLMFPEGSTGYKLAQGSVDGLTKRLAAAQSAAQQALQVQYAKDEQTAESGKLPEVEAPGVSNPTPKGGDPVQNRINKLISDASVALAGATAGAAVSSTGGADALAQLEIHFKDLKEVSDLYIKSGENVKIVTDQQTGAVTSSSAAVNNLTAALDAKNEATRVANNLAAYNVQTSGIQEQNSESQLQLQLSGQTTEEIAKQVALQKELFDAKEKGIPLDDQGYKARVDAITQQYDIKTAIDASAKSTQEWLAPFSSAISSIDSNAETMFETILKGGTVTWQSLADTIKQIFIKLFAELAVLAVVRPIIAPIVDDIFSPGAAQSLGYGAAASSGGGLFGGLLSIFGAGGGVSPGIVGGGAGVAGGSVAGGSSASGGGFGSLLGLGKIFSGNGSSGLFSGISSFLSSPIFPSEATTLGQSLAAADPAAAGLVSANTGALGGLSWGGALSAGAGFASGAYQLLSGGGSTASTISGIGSMVGAGVSLIPGLQPLGIGISLLSSILPGLFGGGPQIPPQPALQYSAGTFGFDPTTGGIVTSGSGEGGGSSIASTAGGVASAILGLLDQTGGTINNSKLYSGTVASGTNYVLSNGQWQPQAYSQADYAAPDGTDTRISYNSSQSLQTTADQLVAAVFQQDVLNGGVSGVSQTLKTVLANNTPTTSQEASSDITNSQKYDDVSLGDNLTQAEQAFQSINTNMASIVSWAQQMGLSVAPLEAAQQQQQQDLATNFMKPITEGIKAFTDPLGAQIDSINDAEQTAVKEAQWMADNISGSFIDMAQVTQYYTDQETEARTQFYASSVSALQNAIDSMQFGSLANGSPDSTLIGTRAAYMADLTAAQGGDSTSVQNLATLGTNYVTAAQKYYGSTQPYNDVLSQVTDAFNQILAGISSGSIDSDGSTSDTDTAQTNAILQSNSALTQQVSDLLSTVASLTAEVQSLTSQMQRVAVSG